MKLDLWLKGINIYFCDDDISDVVDDFKKLPKYFKEVKWYWKPVWLLLTLVNTIDFACILFLFFLVFVVYVIAMGIRWMTIKITPKGKSQWG